MVDHGQLEDFVRPFALLQGALQRKGFAHRINPAPPALTQFRRRRGRVGGQLAQVAQHGHRRGHEPARKKPLARHEHRQQGQTQNGVGQQRGQDQGTQGRQRHGLHKQPGRALAPGAGQHPAFVVVQNGATAGQGLTLLGRQSQRQALEQRRFDRGVGQALAGGPLQRLGGVGQHVECAVGHPNPCGSGLPAAGHALQRVKPEIEADFALVAAVHHHHRAMGLHQFTVELADVGRAPEGDVARVAHQVTLGAGHALQATRLNGHQAGHAHRGQHARGLHPRVAKADVGLCGRKPGRLKAGRALVDGARRLQEHLRTAQPQGLGLAAIFRRPPDLTKAAARGQRGLVQRPAVGQARRAAFRQGRAQLGAPIGRVVPTCFEGLAQVVHMGHGRAGDGGQLLRMLIGLALQIAFGVGDPMPVLQQGEHSQQRHHRHHQPPDEPARVAQGAGRCAAGWPLCSLLRTAVFALGTARRAH